MNIFLRILFAGMCMLFIHSGKAAYKPNDTILIKEYLDKSLCYDKNNVVQFDSALYYIHKSLLLSQELKYDKYLIPIYKTYSDFLVKTGNYTKSITYLYKAMEQLDIKAENNINDSDIHEEYIHLFSTIGKTYSRTNEKEKALNYFQQSLDKVDEMQPRNSEFDANKVKSILYNNMGGVYIEQKDYVNAIHTLNKALIENQNSGRPQKEKELTIAAIYTNLGISNRELQDYEKALTYYTQALEIYQRHESKEFLPHIYNNLGYYYYTSGDSPKAIELLKQSMEISQETSNKRAEKIAINMLANVYTYEKKYADALFMTRKELMLTKDEFNKESSKQVALIEDQYHYEKIIRQEKLEQEIMLARKEKIVLIYVITILILIVICLVLFLIYRNNKIKLKQQNLHKINIELEKQNLELKNNELGKDIESKNKELTTYVMYLNQKNSLISSLIEQLSELNKNENPVNSQKLSYIIHQMKLNLDTTSWEEFQLHFQKVHKDFYTKLNELFPNLTLNEKRLCAFLKMNMTTKEISAITFQSIRSIQIARIRLRKKLQIEKEENLISVLQSL